MSRTIELLRQALGDVGRDAAGVLADDLDLLAGDGVAVLLHIKLEAVVDLRAGIGELAGIFVDHADLDGVLRRWPRPNPSAASVIAAKKHMLLFILFLPRWRTHVLFPQPILVQVGCECNACLGASCRIAAMGRGPGMALEWADPDVVQNDGNRTD